MRFYTVYADYFLVLLLLRVMFLTGLLFALSFYYERVSNFRTWKVWFNSPNKKSLSSPGPE